jgi:hypothetical protein
MDNDRRTMWASISVLLIALMMAPGTALAGGHEHPGKQGIHPAAGHTPSMQPVYPYPGIVADSSYSGCFYTFPILSVYQCPAVVASQPGARVAYLEMNPMAGLLGGQPYLYHH